MNLIISKKVILQKLKISPNVAVYVEHRTLLGESLIWQILCQPLVYNFSRCLHKFLESGQNAACEMYNRHLDIAIEAWFTAVPCYGRFATWMVPVNGSQHKLSNFVPCDFPGCLESTARADWRTSNPF